MRRFFRVVLCPILVLGMLFPMAPAIAEDVPVTSLSIVLPEGEDDRLDIGQTLLLSAAVEPAEASGAALSWASDNALCATVDGGLVTAIAAGQALITATAVSGVSAEITVYVADPAPVATVPVTGITVSAEAGAEAVVLGGTLKLHAAVEPGNATQQAVVWRVTRRRARARARPPLMKTVC